jgi:hypothetical protein
MNNYIILVSHIVVLFPLGICFWKYKKTRDYKALYVSFQLFYTACFSVVYHTYDCENISKNWDPNRNNLKTWRFLDFVSARTVLFTNIAYTMRFKTEMFYILSHGYMILFITLEFFSPNNINTFITVLLCILIVIIKIKTLYEYISNFWKHSVFTIGLLIGALYFFFEGYIEYNTFHSMWHLLIFGAAGSACLLKTRLDDIKPLRTVTIYREKSDSL